jgi:hypothetical protein
MGWAIDSTTMHGSHTVESLLAESARRIEGRLGHGIGLNLLAIEPVPGSALMMMPITVLHLI